MLRMLKNTLAFLVLLCCASALAPVQEKEPVWAFKFQDYVVTQVFKGKPAPALLARNERFRTVIRRGAAKGPNFAGRFTVVGWGCGAGCVAAVLVDAATGRIYRIPFGTLAMDAASGPNYRGPVYQLKSRLLIADGCPNEEEKKCGTYYYEWTANKFKLLRYDPQPPTKQ
jgi:hypothetical protein